ncbi:sulfotransferase family 2 domain-containing protein [Salinisphaera sp. P385]|uniref:Sulfotransferase family 2 domain-containing protein n=1 Tax=Spectribacter acetivorans TaxID=3075603 RepID=A0ABU3BDX2_9GAMM|nr:sulfotransferase family 2 domain-containing protein [Salinisphaera sp. P385]MDT0619873.1 sulfotransferase family 2 domain-containing protein [Salinisphaera sp. P385]
MTVLKSDNWRDAALRLAKRTAGRSLYLPTEAPHFQVKVDGEWYVFCAIHKNASSSIRSIVENASALKRAENQSIFNFLFLNHLVRSRKEIERARHVMVFVRHPLDRVVSCFQNKFIQQKGNRTIFADYRAVTKRDPCKSSFEEFVSGYITACFAGKTEVGGRHDRHIYTQRQQLLPVDYDVVKRVDEFDETMERAGLAHLLPGRANATSGKVRVSDAWRLTADELNEHYRKTGETPGKASLLSDELVDQINQLYRADLQAFGHLFDKEVG